MSTKLSPAADRYAQAHHWRTCMPERDDDCWIDCMKHYWHAAEGGTRARQAGARERAEAEAAAGRYRLVAQAEEPLPGLVAQSTLDEMRVERDWYRARYDAVDALTQDNPSDGDYKALLGRIRAALMPVEEES